MRRPSAPSVHLRALATWLVIFPEVTLVNLVLSPSSPPVQTTARAALVTIVVVPPAVYLLVPALLRVLSRRVHEGHAAITPGKACRQARLVSERARSVDRDDGGETDHPKEDSMNTANDPGDLDGTVDDQQRALADKLARGDALTEQWLLRQLQRTQAAWAADQTALDIDRDAHTDY